MKQPVRFRFDSLEFTNPSQNVGISRITSGCMKKLKIPVTTRSIIEVFSFPKTLAITCKIGLTYSAKLYRGKKVGSKEKMFPCGIRWKDNLS